MLFCELESSIRLSPSQHPSMTVAATQVLCNLLGKPPGVLFSELEGERSEFAVGDVQYHLGQQGTLSFPLPVRRG